MLLASRFVAWRNLMHQNDHSASASRSALSSLAVFAASFIGTGQLTQEFSCKRAHAFALLIIMLRRAVRVTLHIPPLLFLVTARLSAATHR